MRCKRNQALQPRPHTRCGRRGCSRSDREPGSELRGPCASAGICFRSLGAGHPLYPQLPTANIPSDSASPPRARLTQNAGASGARICISETTKASHSLTKARSVSVRRLVPPQTCSLSSRSAARAAMVCGTGNNRSAPTQACWMPLVCLCQMCPGLIDPSVGCDFLGTCAALDRRFKQW